MPDGSPWPRISIVTPSYHQGQFIEETIRSVLLQGYPDLEYVVVDGGSTDGTVATIRKYDQWLGSWASEPDRGQSHAINKGFQRCSGDIMTFMNSDDVYLKGAFSDVGSRWPQLRDCGAIVGSFYFMDSHSHFLGTPNPPRLPGEGPTDLTLAAADSWRLHQVATFYTRSALDHVGRFVREELRYTMDRDLLYRVCRKHRILLADRPYAAFRRHDDSKSMSQILAFSREMAALHLEQPTGSTSGGEWARRRQLARYRRMRGYLSYAKHNGNRLASGAALLAALFYSPSLLVTRRYLSFWLDVLSVKPIVRRLRAV